MYLNRTMEAFYLRTQGQFPAMLVTGPRQVGKTSMLKRLCGSERTYVTLDDPETCRLAKADPGLFLQRFKPPLLIDEIQYAPELLPFVKMAGDREGQGGMFWLTGSQQFHLMKGVSESLAGRVGIVNLLGLSRREADGAPAQPPFLPTLDTAPDAGGLDLQALYRRAWRGSFPAIATDDSKDRDLFYSSLVQTYLQRDVRDLAKVGDEMAFLRFLRAAAARTGQLLCMADLARDADIAQNTAKSWLSILQASGIVHLLEPFHCNLTLRLVKAPKLYFLDTGLCAYLTDWSTPETLEAGAMAGAIFETWCVAEIIKSYWHNGLRAPLHYYRDKDKKEIDLLIVRDGVLHPVEFKKSTNPKKDDVRHFALLDKLGVPVGAGAVVCLRATALPLTDRIQAIPAAAL